MTSRCRRSCQSVRPLPASPARNSWPTRELRRSASVSTPSSSVVESLSVSAPRPRLRVTRRRPRPKTRSRSLPLRHGRRAWTARHALCAATAPPRWMAKATATTTRHSSVSAHPSAHPQPSPHPYHTRRPHPPPSALALLHPHSAPTLRTHLHPPYLSHSPAPTPTDPSLALSLSRSLALSLSRPLALSPSRSLARSRSLLASQRLDVLPRRVLIHMLSLPHGEGRPLTHELQHRSTRTRTSGAGRGW